MDKEFKFIIDEGELKLRKCTYHRELAYGYKTGDDDKTKYPNVIGGGRWNWDREENIILLYGNSFQFGGCTKEQILAALPKTIEEDTCHFNWYFAGCQLKYSPSEYYSDALKDAELIFTIPGKPDKD